MEIIVDSGRRKPERYSSRVEGITNKHLHLAMPMRKSIPVLLLPETNFYGRFVADEAAWQFTSTFIDKQISPVPIWIASLPFDIEKIQLREYVRIPVALPLEVSIVNENGETEPFKAITKDISGGGLQIIYPKPIPYGKKLHITINLPDFGAIQAKGEVIRTNKPITSELEIYWLAIKFTEIAEKDREKIIKYVFKLQIERRQKGLLT